MPVSDGRGQIRDIRTAAPTDLIVVTDPADAATCLSARDATATYWSVATGHSEYCPIPLGLLMPSVVGFWQLPEDEWDFLRYVRSIGEVVACPSTSSQRPFGVSWRPLEAVIATTNPVQVEFTRVDFASNIEVRPTSYFMQLPKGRKDVYSVQAGFECVIGYSRGMVRDPPGLGMSNLAFYSEYPSKDLSTIVTKDAEFLKWAKKVFGWMRRFTPERVIFNGFPYRATRRVKEAIAKGEVQLVL